MECYWQKIKGGGFKLTPRRMAIVELFVKYDTSFTPEEVWGKLKKDFVRCGRPGVYRNLESLVECGVLTRIQQFDRRKHYGLCCASHHDHHHHITCVKCGKVDDIQECAIGSIKKIKGYKVVSHFMQVNGICAGCSRGNIF